MARRSALYQLCPPAPPLGTLVGPILRLSGLSGLGTALGAAAAALCGIYLYLSLRSMLLVGTVSELKGSPELLMSSINDIASLALEHRVELTSRRFIDLQDNAVNLVVTTAAGIEASPRAHTISPNGSVL
jgi:hypothetical protein